MEIAAFCGSPLLFVIMYVPTYRLQYLGCPSFLLFHTAATTEQNNVRIVLPLA